MNLFFTQIDPPPSLVVNRLAAKGWCVRHLPFRKVRFLRRSLPALPGGYDALIISSKRAATWLREHAPKESWPPLALVGKSSARLLSRHPQLFETPAAHADALRVMLQARFENRGQFLFLCGAWAGPVLRSPWGQSRIDVLEVYRTTQIERDFPCDFPLGMVYFQAPSTVSDFASRYSRPPRFVAAIGPSTCKALQQRNWPIHFQPSRPETEIFVEEIPQSHLFIQVDKPT